LLLAGVGDIFEKVESESKRDKRRGDEEDWREMGERKQTRVKRMVLDLSG
jgi:hypothetical protein